MSDVSIKVGVGGFGAPLDARWQAGVWYWAGQLVVNGNVIYRCTSAHLSRDTFDITERANFVAITSNDGTLAASGPGDVPGAAMGSAQVINQGGGTTSIWVGTLSAALCDLTFTGWPPAGTYGEVLVLVHQDATTAGRGLTESGVTLWESVYGPVMPSPISSVLDFTVFSVDGGTTVVGVHGQPIRPHTLRIGTPADGVLSLFPEYFETDARIVKIRPSNGGPSVTNPSLYDILKGAGNGAATTIYPTNPGRRPSVAAGQMTNAAALLPDTLLIAPGEYLQGKTITASGATAAALKVICVEAA